MLLKTLITRKSDWRIGFWQFRKFPLPNDTLLYNWVKNVSEDSKIAKAIGTLFVVTMVLGMIDAYTVAPMLHSPLSDYYLNESRFYVGAFAILFMALGVVGISILFYPILERHNRLIAITYVCARVMECLLLVVGVIVYFLLLSLSHEAAQAWMQDEVAFRTIASLAVEARYSGYQVAMLILGIASMLICYLLYKTRLIPRWISALGFIGYALLLVSAPLDLMGVIDTTGAGGLLYMPGGVFELLVLPIWLITKGFNSSSDEA